ncbi:hypothetical protein D9V29_06900 [Mycetocola manganoxydans]|uniref:Uncharacterized protein n=1 Tax=Mycetocola manganoxydans TaxID=699879 RepID=A0A3L6ZW88_9MICO|nr:hypothetical protein [Mycetocola manganoxydans]RLP72149.1 hypothetical protein D9V29_06900 [Mycetocola manganoxydans]GHD52287.1 hypothetical protein GCM10008097_28000 [Mycetocola manganoxydans]
MFEGGSWIWGIALIAMLVVVIALFGRRLKGAFSAEGSARFDTTEIPPDDPETREFIVRDDQTGSRMQFVTLHEQGRVVSIVVPQKHLRKGVEVDLFEAVVPTAPQVRRWSWPQTTPDGYAALQIIARRMPDLEFIDAQGNRVV